MVGAPGLILWTDTKPVYCHGDLSLDKEFRFGAWTRIGLEQKHGTCLYSGPVWTSLDFNVLRCAMETGSLQPSLLPKCVILKKVTLS